MSYFKKTQDEAATEQDAVSTAPTEQDETEMLKEKYGKVYRVGLTLEPDDETTIELEYRFVKPKPASYDRYMKTGPGNITKASQAFALDNVIQEDAERLQKDMSEYPALCMSVCDKLLAMLGLSKTTNLKAL